MISLGREHSRLPALFAFKALGRAHGQTKFAKVHPSVSFPGEKRSAEPGRWSCSTTPILPRRTSIARIEKRQKDSPPGSASLRRPPSGGRQPVSLGLFGGLGATPPVILSDEPVASPARNNPLRESSLKGQLSALTARVSDFLRQNDQSRGPEYSGPLGGHFCAKKTISTSLPVPILQLV
uniref:Uncharacterized protein n=1 Tax=uncultured prokaryote TaxID=198431 RepID=A0A0H5Q3G3_9ZZZZ|nr:hypothetical protein [uncultured prokaryote]